MPVPVFVSRRIAAGLFCLASLALGGAARAQTFEVIAQGVVTGVANDEPLLDSSIAVGTPFEYDLYFSYAADHYGDGSSDEVYLSAAGSPGAIFRCGDYVVTATALHDSSIDVTNDYAFGSGTKDRLEVGTFGGTVTGGPAKIYHPQVSYAVFSSDLSALTSEALPDLSAWSLTRFPDPSVYDGLHFYGQSAPDSTQAAFGVTGRLTSLQAVATPEPSPGAALGLGVLGLAGLALRARRRPAKVA